MSRRGLQVFLVALGSVALVAGSLAMIFGAGLVPGDHTFTANVDSEMRFFATWYAVAGVVVLRAVKRVESQGTIVRIVGAAFFLAGCARALSLVVVGTPDRQFVVLMVIEMALPVVIVPWQASVARQSFSGHKNTA